MTDVLPTAPVRPAVPVWGPVARRLRLALVLGWLVVGVLVVAVGAHESTFGDLERAVAAGQVDEVRVDGGLEPGGSGFSTVRVTWRDGLAADTTEVLQAVPLGEARDAATRDDVTAVLDRSVADRLRALDPDVVVTQVRTTPSLVADPAGWHLPGWSGWPALVMMLLTVCSVIGSPLPWRATRWAWFWLVSASPIGLAAYLLLAGPLPLLRERFAVRPGFTGGWGLILGMGLAALVGW